MEYTPLTIYRGQPGINNETIYTVPANCIFVLKQIIVVSEAETMSTAYVYIEKGGNLLKGIPPIKITEADNRIFNMNVVLDEGDKIVIKQTLEEVLTLSINGTKMVKNLPQMFDRALIAINWDDAKYNYSNWTQFASTYTTWDSMPKRTWKDIKEMVGYWEYLKSTIM